MKKPNRGPASTNTALIELQRAATAEGVWKASVKLMRAVLPVYNVLIGLPSLGIMPMFMRATLPIQNVERFAQLAPLNRAIMEMPLAPVARMSDHHDPDSPNGRAFHEEFLKPMGWRFGAAMLFWSAEGRFIGQLAVIRTQKQGDFTNLEMNLLRELHPHVEAVVQRLLALEERFAAHLSLEHAIDALPLPIVIASWDGAVNYCNAAGREAMSAWSLARLPAPRALKPTGNLPPQIRTSCQAMREEWERGVRADDIRHVARDTALTHASDPNFRAEIRLVEAKGGRALQPSFAIHFHLPPAENTESARALASLSKLTHSEHEVVRLAAAGHDNADIAKAFGVSLSTVRTHLRHVFQKLGITTRSRLAPLYQGLKQR
jgi:DNA-binding CsgD family transcriptional regulator